jgi:hypothetical protein
MKTLYFFPAVILFLSVQVHAKRVSVGGSGGYLNYPNATTSLGLVVGDTIAIKPGTYSGFTFGNLKGTYAKKIVIVNDKGLVEIIGTSSSALNAASNIVLTGSGAKGI